MFREDIDGSIAHAKMLGAKNIISASDAELIIKELQQIKTDLESGKLQLDETAEDIHSFVELELTNRIGDAGKKLHTARSRNDQVATDLKLYLRNRINELQSYVKDFAAQLTEQAEKHINTIMPGFTHLQPAQPVTLAQHLLAYCSMLMRDFTRMEDCKTRMNLCPLGSGALAGTTFPIDRQFTAKELGFTGPTLNSIDSVSDRDHVIELNSALSILMMHLSRFAEEIIIWSTPNFGFVELSDGYSTGSSMMPQKKNPDMAELVRGKVGKVYGNLISLLTLMKAQPLAYNKDMQEDKQATFESCDIAALCLQVMAGMIETASFNKNKMADACDKGFINATDCADYLVTAGVSFRDAYKTVGELVAYCIEKGTTLNKLELPEFQKFSNKFMKDIYAAIDMKTCVNKRNSFGGTAPASVKKQIAVVKKWIA